MSRQILKIFGVGAASGVAAILVLIGLVLFLVPELKGYGQVALFFGIFLLIVYGLLGVVGILKRLSR
ncbi:hypothetical protein KY360_06685 [Candidatus Woesearchaeota archaeon]|nr:hypothetical protein [Candidatus Woesearchaeota archaeon]